MQISLNIGSVGKLLQSLEERWNICPGFHTTYLPWFCATLYFAAASYYQLSPFPGGHSAHMYITLQRGRFERGSGNEFSLN